MLSRSAPQLQYLVEKAKTGAEQARELQQRRKEQSKKRVALLIRVDLKGNCIDIQLELFSTTSLHVCMYQHLAILCIIQA